MPYPNEHAARLRDPGDFDPKSFRRTNGGSLYGGNLKIPVSVGIVWGKLKKGRSAPSDPPMPQALRFPKDRWTAEKARAWLQENKIKHIGFEAAASEVAVSAPEAWAWAWHPDDEDSSTWAVPLCEAGVSMPTRRSLGRAVAMLTPSGLGGERVELSETVLPLVHARLREAYRSIGVADRDQPQWIRAERAPLLAVETGLLEAADADAGRVTLTVICAGHNALKSRYYPAEVLKRCVEVITPAGLKMFADHQTAAEEKARPEGSVRDWVATVEKSWWDPASKSIKAQAVVVADWLRSHLRNLRDAGRLGDLGVSIRAVGRAVEAKIDGVKTQFVEDIVKARSVDFVTEPGAGGRVEAYESAGGHVFDLDLITEADLRRERPDLVEGILAELAETYISAEAEEGATMEEVEQLKVDLEAERAKNIALVAQVAELKAEKAKVEFAGKVDEALKAAQDLPDVARANVRKRLEGLVEANIPAAIKQEQDYLASLGLKKKEAVVKGLGDQEAGGSAEGALETTMEESFRRKGHSEAQAKRMAEQAAR